jgi:hypothetical protein
MKTYLSKKWNINAEMGFIEVDINFFIGLKINDKTSYNVQGDFNLTKIMTDDGEFIIENNDWIEIESELRKIKLDNILGK